MSLRDSRDVAFSTDNRQSLDLYEHALDLFHGYFEDPVAVIDEALEDDPEFVAGHLLRAGLMLSTSDKTCEGYLRESVEAAEALIPIANDREQQHIRAARAWLEGDRRSVGRTGEVPGDAAGQRCRLGGLEIGARNLKCESS